MDTMAAFMRGEAARRAGSPLRVFDWEKAARLIVERRPTEAGAGLAGDWGWTGGVIWINGDVIRDQYTYLASLWATPILDLDGEEIDCWRLQSDTPGWDSDTKWPDEAIAILRQAGLVPS